MTDKKRQKNITDNSADKTYIYGVFAYIIFHLLVNLILGSYIVYIAKVLHVLHLPVCVTSAPYIQPFINTSEVVDPNDKASIFASECKDIPGVKYELPVGVSPIVGINYILSFIPKPEITRENFTGTEQELKAAITKQKSEEPWLLPRELFYTRIKIDNTKPTIFDCYSWIHNSSSMVLTYFGLFMQKLYSFIYWGLCWFFSFVYGSDKWTSKWTLYFWELFMILLGPYLFLFYSAGLAVAASFYMPGFLLYNWWSMSWKYITPDKKCETIQEESKSHYLENVNTFMSLVWYIIRGWFTFGSIGAIIVMLFMGAMSFITTSSIIGLCIIMPILLRLAFTKSTIVVGDQDTQKPYSVMNLITSKWDAITYLITFIFVAYSKKSYGDGVYYGLFVASLIIWFSSNTHKLLYYPFIPDDLKIFMEVALKPNSTTEYNTKDSKQISCFNSKNCKDTNIDAIFNEVKKLHAVANLQQPVVAVPVASAPTVPVPVPA